MTETNTADPNYFHKVVDCQWACPAHTDVPEYIRLIAQGRFTDAYMVNRKSNVFPGILGRVCDRPCEPACRRGRVEKKPVAICRLKRVAADHKDSIVDRLPVVPQQKNGKRVACIGAGPASLTVANDLLPLGYEVVIFEQWDKPGGLMRTNIPAFRLPETVIDEEIGYITGMGAEIRYNSRIESLRKLLATGGFDAVFVGSGAPKGKELDLPGRQQGAANIHIGIDWLESVAFKHLDKIGNRVLIIGVGNTAMDCCRSSLRLGATDVKVMARKPRQFFKASEWELEDAESENVEIVVNHSPKAFVVEKGRLKGMMFDTMEYDFRIQSMRGNNTPMSHATAFHEMIPGHNLVGYMGARYRGYRPSLGGNSPFYAEGWPLYWELTMYELGFHDTPEKKVGALFWRMHRCARIIFSLKFHMGDWSPQECVDFLVDRVGFERENAAGEVRRSFQGGYGPLYQAAYLLGGLQLRGLRRELVDGKQMAAKAFHDEVLRQGSMPITLLRLVLTRQKLTRDTSLDWKFYADSPAK